MECLLPKAAGRLFIVSVVYVSRICLWHQIFEGVDRVCGPLNWGQGWRTTRSYVGSTLKRARNTKQKIYMYPSKPNKYKSLKIHLPILIMAVYYVEFTNKIYHVCMIIAIIRGIEYIWFSSRRVRCAIGRGKTKGKSILCGQKVNEIQFGRGSQIKRRTQ